MGKAPQKQVAPSPEVAAVEVPVTLDAQPVVSPEPQIVEPVVVCFQCKHWRRSNPKAGVGQCIYNSRFTGNTFYSSGLGTCELAEIG